MSETKEMTETVAQKEKNPHHFRWTALSALGIVLCFIFIWGFTSSWGSVNVSRMKFAYSESSGDSGSYAGSYLLYQPLSATKDDPGQLIVLFHGGTSNSFAVKNYAIEYARRGYVVVTPDLPGTGYSDNIGASTTEEGNLAFLAALQEHLRSLNFVKQGEYAIVGFSNGSTTARNMISMFPDEYISYGNVTNFKLAEEEASLALGIPYWGIQPYGAVDHEKVSSGAKPRTPEYYDGGIEQMENSVCYYTTAGYVHVLVPDSTEMVGAAMLLQDMVVSSGSSLDSSNLVFWFGEIFAALGLAMMIVFLVNLAGLLIETKFFSSLKHEPCPVLAPKPKDTKGRLINTGILVVEFVVFVIAYKLMGGKVVLPTTAFTPMWINNMMGYLLLLAAYQIIKFVVWHFKGTKNGPATLTDYGIAFQHDARLTAANIGKAALLALIGITLIILFIDFMNNALGINYQFMVFTMSSLPLKKLAATPAYILMYIFIFFGGQVTAYVVSRTKDYGNSTIGTLLDGLKGAVITIAPILLWCIINLLVWKEVLPSSGMDIVADRLYGYVMMVIITAPLHAFLYKKTKNIWPGLFMCAGLMTFMVCANFPLSVTYFG